eukprot:gene37731-45839_t
MSMDWYDLYKTQENVGYMTEKEVKKRAAVIREVRVCENPTTSISSPPSPIPDNPSLSPPLSPTTRPQTAPAHSGPSYSLCFYKLSYFAGGGRAGKRGGGKQILHDVSIIVF